jgi:hypothetical protein
VVRPVVDIDQWQQQHNGRGRAGDRMHSGIAQRLCVAICVSPA